eukprot:TRINITY_DN164_c0_g1_i3.p1 TRINITY_DN164_c0_g1~~TRINITY_DN164_c0_g1_i3.p1  ORF type:complete len:1124 (+),score=269.42 TRINITY_DN164_c0_g1_i3:75-3374(+)
MAAVPLQLPALHGGRGGLTPTPPQQPTSAQLAAVQERCPELAVPFLLATTARRCAAVGPLPRAPRPRHRSRRRASPGPGGRQTWSASQPASSASPAAASPSPQPQCAAPAQPLHIEDHEHQPLRATRNGMASFRMRGQQPHAASSTVGLKRFEEGLARTLAALPADSLTCKWDQAGLLLERVAALGKTWGDAFCSRISEEVNRLLAIGEAAQRAAGNGPGTESSSHMQPELVAASCAALCMLLDALAVGVPALSHTVRGVLNHVLAAIFVAPPPLAETGSLQLFGGAEDAGGSQLFEAFCTAGPWCQHGSGAQVPDEGNAPPELSRGDSVYLHDSGATNLLEEASMAVAAAGAANPCSFLAQFFENKCKQLRVDVADCRTVVADGSATAYLARKVAELPQAARASHTVGISPVLLNPSPFAWFANVNGTHKHLAGSLHVREMYPVQKRLTFTFLELLGRQPPPVVNGTRSWDRRPEGDLLFHVPLLKLRDPVETWETDLREIVINAGAVDRLAEHRVDEDTLFRSFCPEGTGPPAEAIYGKGMFHISHKELFECERSTRVSVSGPITARFLCELARFTTDPQTAWFFSIFRSVPLVRIGDADVTGQLRDIFADRYDAELRNVSQAEDVCSKVRRAHNATGAEAERAKHYGRLARVEQDLHQHRLWRDAARASLEQLLRADVSRIAQRFRTWLQGVLKVPRDYGFDSRQKAQVTVDQSLAELATCICISQHGHFFVDGSGGNANLICPKPPQHVTFLSATGIDFNNQATTLLEAQKYFLPLALPGADPTARPTAWKGFRADADRELLERLKLMYISIFSAAQTQGVRNPSMLVMGLGAFLLNVHQSDRKRVRELYFTAQFELLAERDWGFENYFLNGAQSDQEAREVLEAGIRHGRFNDPHRGRFLRCNIVFHSRDCKFLAVELARREMHAAILNPSDCATLMQGVVGNHWEQGRCGYYGGEEDFAATSTGILAHSAIGATLTTPSRILCVERNVQNLAQSRYVASPPPPSGLSFGGVDDVDLLLGSSSSCASHVPGFASGLSTGSGRPGVPQRLQNVVGALMRCKPRKGKQQTGLLQAAPRAAGGGASLQRMPSMLRNR